jgi:protein SCO1
MIWARLAVVLCLALPWTAPPAEAGHSAFTTAQLDALAFQQHPGAALPLDTPLVDENGRTISLGAFFGQRPVLIVMDYLHCETLCGFVLANLVRSLDNVPLQGGEDYEVLAISIDPRDTPAAARAAREQYLARAQRPGGWHFLTGSEQAVARIAAAIGFPYRYDADADQFAHPAGVTVAAPDGTIARYILGLDYRPLDLRLALTEAARGTISTPATSLLLLCYCYDPETGRYSAPIAMTMRGLAAMTVLGIAAFLWRLSRARGW